MKWLLPLSRVMVGTDMSGFRQVVRAVSCLDWLAVSVSNIRNPSSGRRVFQVRGGLLWGAENGGRGLYVPPLNIRYMFYMPQTSIALVPESVSLRSLPQQPT